MRPRSNSIRRSRPWTRLAEKKGEKGDISLALALNNRGVAARALGKLELAQADFDRAITILSQSGQPPSVSSKSDEAMSSELGDSTMELAVAFGYSEKSVEVHTEAHVRGQNQTRITDMALATTLKNRGYLSLVRGNQDAASRDFAKAREVYQAE